MSALSMAVLLWACALLQGLVPPLAMLGQAKVPFLAVMPIYYALTRKPAAIVAAAVAAGLIQDALSLAPLGGSALLFTAGGLLVHRFRETIAGDTWIPLALLGLAAGGGTVLLTGMSLTMGDEAGLWFPWWWVVAKAAGTAALGAFAAPAVYGFALQLDQLVGLVPRPEAEK